MQFFLWLVFFPTEIKKCNVPSIETDPNTICRRRKIENIFVAQRRGNNNLEIDISTRAPNNYWKQNFCKVFLLNYYQLHSSAGHTWYHFGNYSNIQVKVLYAYRRRSRISKPDDTHPVYIESHKRGRTQLNCLGISILPLIEQLQHT